MYSTEILTLAGSLVAVALLAAPRWLRAAGRKQGLHTGRREEQSSSLATKEK